MKLNPKNIRKVQDKMMEKFQGSDLRSRLAGVWSKQSEIIIAVVAGLIVGILLLLMR